MVDHVEVNRAHFDKIAGQYDEHPLALELAKKIGGAFLKQYEFKEDETNVMEFACGTGARLRCSSRRTHLQPP